MSMIKCPECGNEFSDKASFCPHCGCPKSYIDSLLPVTVEKLPSPAENLESGNIIPPIKPNHKKRNIIIAIVAAIAIIALVFIGFLYWHEDDEVKITPEYTLAIKKYDALGGYSEGLAPARRNGLWGYIDTKGNEVISCRFGQQPGEFHGGVAIVPIAEPPFMKYIDTKGNQTDRRPISSSSETDLNMPSVFAEGGKYGLKSHEGIVISPAKYDSIGKFNNGVALATLSSYSATSPGDTVIYPVSPDDITLYGYIDRKGFSTFSESDFLKISNAKKKVENNRKQEELLKREQMRIEEEKRLEFENRGPEWINGSWSCYSDGVSLRIDIDRNTSSIEAFADGYHVSSYQYKYSADDNRLHLIFNGSTTSGYFVADNSIERIVTANGIKMTRGGQSSVTSGRSSYSGNNNSSSSNHSTRFNSHNDVMIYASENSFVNSRNTLRIKWDGVYLNGRCLTGAPRVVSATSTSATIEASAFGGGNTLRFYVNPVSGTITQAGDVYRIK